MTVDDVIEVLDRLDAAGISVWLDGGWGVDALIGRQTRSQSDLDLALARDNHERDEHDIGLLAEAFRLPTPPPLEANS